MVSVFLREQKRYTQDELIEAFDCSEERAVRLIKRLKEYSVLKIVKATEKQKDLSDLLDDDIEVADVIAGEDEYFYVFTYVGVTIVEGRVLKCYPKYLLNATEPKNELKEVLGVLEKYNAKEQIIRMYNESNDSSSLNMLAAMLFLIHDYYEYGSYNNTQDIIEVNGAGDILWDKTINESFTLISNNRPYYPELLTRKRVNNEFDYFKRLHECILSKCSKQLKDADLLDLFDIVGVDLSDEEIDDFGEIDYVLHRIKQELNVQFNTRKQRLLKTMYAYIDNSKSEDVDSFSMFGTNSFNLVWEEVCAEVMDNQLKKPLSALKLPIQLLGTYDKKNLLISLIEKPKWYGYKKEQASEFMKEADKTLIPDLVSIHKKDNSYQFIIFDAKYYNIQLEEDKTLRGQPGIESITKQYIYQLAYQKFVKDHNIDKVCNCFLIPTEGNEIIDKGYVSMKMLDELGLEKIQLRMMPASEMYEYYLKNKKMEISLLKL